MRRKQQIRSVLAPLFIAICIGALSGLGAVFFRWLIHRCTDLFAALPQWLQVAPAHSWWWHLLLPALIGLLLGPIIVLFAPETRGPGVPEVMEALALRGGHIRHRVTLFKTGATALFIAAGASVGREGPIVQIGASIGSSLCQILKFDRSKRRLAVACGAAAGIAATFQAPMAGMLFVVEILLCEIEAISLSSLVLASVTGTLVSRACWQGAAVFHIPAFSIQHPADLLLYLTMGLCCGMLALLLMAVVFGLPRILQKTGLPLGFQPALGGLAVGLIGCFWPQALGLGYSTINQALTGQLPLTLAASLVVIKILSTGVCLGSGMSGGIFAPSLFIGAMVGTVFGNIAQSLWPATHELTAHFSLIGMGALVSGTTLAPITAILTIFELTNNYEVILPLMVACIPSVLVVQLVHGYSVYETNLLGRGINIVRGHDVNRLRNMLVAGYMCSEYEAVAEDLPLGRVAEQMAASSFPHFIVVDGKKELTGVLTLRDLRVLLGQSPLENISWTSPASALMQTKVITLLEGDSLEKAFDLFAHHHFSFLPVVSDSHPRRVVGVLKKSDLVAAYDQQVLKDQILPSPSWFFPLQKQVRPPKERLKLH
nr:chloride channel protein [uncultured Desulfobulbus sp.]